MKRANSTKSQSRAGDPQHFVGDVRRQDLLAVEDPRSAAILVRFAPGSRTRWHSHAAGQYIYVVDGHGLIQSRGGSVESLGAGDCVYTAPNEEHWHGATERSAVSHIAFSLGETIWPSHGAEID